MIEVKTTLVQREIKRRQMAAFRGAVRGWAFANSNGVASRLTAGKRERDLLPPELHQEADEMLDLLRKELVNSGHIASS